MTEPQTYANHHRYDPWYHYVAFALALLVLILPIVRLFRGHGGVWQLAAALLLFILLLKVRTYALRVQDRVIRLEETLRLQALLGVDLRARISELRPAQFVALRFAADGELAARAAEALNEKLGAA